LITTYVNKSDFGPELILTVHARVCNKTLLFTHAEEDKLKAERWICHQYRDILADTIVKFIHHRRAAARNFRIRNEEMEKSLAILEVRFEGAKHFTFADIIQRISRSESHLRYIMPPNDSFWASWITTIESVIIQCKRHVAALQENDGKEKNQNLFRVLDMVKGFAGYIIQ
jgi:hypothetical protein